MAKKLLEKAKVAEAKKPEIIKDLNQCIIEVSSQSAQNPVSLLTKEKYKIWNCHKQVNEKEKITLFPSSGGQFGAPTIFPLFDAWFLL